MTTELHRITSLLRATFEGEPWHGPSVKSTLKEITASQASDRPLSACHTIHELISHMTAWRTFTSEKLSGQGEYDITTSEQDWPATVNDSEDAWQQTLLKLENSQQQLLAALSKATDDKLRETVLGRKYDFYFLLHGIIQHDLYHLGQIAMLKKAFPSPH
jgi:uncharacterized damage-inducible protein DinB